MVKRMLPTALIALMAVCPSAVHSQGFVDVETGVAFTGYNDVRIPSDTGTLVSLKTDIASDPALALRVRVGYTLGGRHTVLALAAPLSVSGSGTLERTIDYQGASFAAGTKVSSTYRFDSFRLTYRYTLVDNDAMVFAAGITGKIRSADIAIMSDSAYAHRSDLGIVPLLSAMFRVNIAGPLSILVDADALVTPFGRAEDALFALQYRLSDRATSRIGYRILEGGSDGGGSVYTFALFHYATMGITVNF